MSETTIDSFGGDESASNHDAPARIYTDEGTPAGNPATCACCGAELSRSYTVSGDVPIKHASFGCFSDVCGGSQGSATYVFVTGEEMTPSERRSRVEQGKNVGFCEFEEDENGDLVRDENGDPVKEYHHRFPGPQSPANVAGLINDTYPVGEYVLQRTDTKETTITLPANASGTDADRLAACYAVEGETWEAFDVQVFGERDRPQVVVRRV